MLEPDPIQGYVRLRSRLPVMPCQIKETQAAASHRAEYNNAGELQEGSFCCSWHAGNIQEKKKPSTTHNQAKLLALTGQYTLSELQVGWSTIFNPPHTHKQTFPPLDWGAVSDHFCNFTKLIIRHSHPLHAAKARKETPF